jgi:hypothetical protein
MMPGTRRGSEASGCATRKRVKPEIGIRAMRTKQVACDILPLRIYSLIRFRDEKIDNMVRFGDVWCRLVTHMRKKTKRFSVSLAEGDYKKLQRIANGHRPPFSLQFIVNWAIQGVLDRANDPQLLLELGNPLRKAQ